MSNVTVLVPSLNGSLIDIDLCNKNICSLEYAEVDYVPSMAVNMAYLIIFALLLLAQVVQGCIYRTWGFLVGMFLGLVLEVIGYVGRVELHGDPFNFNDFVINLVCLTIAPACISASIYLCLSRLIVVYGENIAPLRPRNCTLIFICCDLISLILQATGGGIAATADDHNTSQIGVHIMVAGLAFQVASALLFIVLALEFVRRVRKASRSQMNDNFRVLQSKRMFRLLPYGLALAILTIFTRCVFRVAELQAGFNGALANNQTAFNILEGPMIFIAVLSLTILHPGACFHGAWADANWTWKAKKQEMESSSHSSAYNMVSETSKSRA